LRPLLAINMDRYIGPQSAVAIELHIGIYLANIMYPYGGTLTELTVALHGVLYFAIIMER
jgi:hypothetical protein